jgi:hypothetical protein
VYNQEIGKDRVNCNTNGGMPSTWLASFRACFTSDGRKKEYYSINLSQSVGR